MRAKIKYIKGLDSDPLTPIASCSNQYSPTRIAVYTCWTHLFSMNTVRPEDHCPRALICDKKNEWQPFLSIFGHVGAPKAPRVTI